MPSSEVRTAFNLVEEGEPEGYCCLVCPVDDSRGREDDPSDGLRVRDRSTDT